MKTPWLDLGLFLLAALPGIVIYLVEARDWGWRWPLDALRKKSLRRRDEQRLSHDE